MANKEFDRVVHPPTSLIDFFKAAPYPEIELDIERAQDAPRVLNL